MKRRIYNCPLPIIGLTGGIATGKSLITSLLREKKYTVICADELVHEIYQTEKMLQFIKNVALKAFDTNSNTINFKILREIFFNDSDIKKSIENQIYQLIPEHFEKKLSLLKQSPPFIFYDVPLLYEKKLELLIDQVILVYCPASMQLERLLKRDKIDLRLAHKMIQQQMNIEEKKIKADFIIDNSFHINDENELKSKLNIQIDQIIIKINMGLKT